MTGNLNAGLNTNPPFPGKERHFLRAQIARISHSCTLVPVGMYGEAESEEEVKEYVIQEEFAMPPLAEMGPETLCH
jgi:radial spoke head protein 4A